MRTPFLLATVLLLASALAAQDEQAGTGIDVRFEAGWSQIDLDNDVLIAVGNVQLRWKGGELRCDNAVIWLMPATEAPAEGEPADADEQQGGLRVKEIYAEGQVHVRHEEARFHLESARGFVDPASNRGVFFDSTMSMTVDSRDGPLKLTARAAEAIQVARDRFELQDIFVHTSPFAEPGWHLAGESLRLQLDPPAQDPDGPPGKTVRNVHFELDGSVFAIEGVDLLPLPPISGNTQDDTLGWVRRVGVDSGKRFGASGFVSIGTPIRIDDRRWGDWTLHTRYFSERGPGLGLDLDYQRPDYRGEFRGFYQRDRGKDQLFGKPPQPDRGRALWRHRHNDIGQGIQLDVEFSKITDRGFLPEYEENEFKEGKDQETLVYMKRALENRAATLIVSTRLNEFQTQVEQQPQFGYNLISEPLIDIGDTATIYFDADYEVSRSRLRYDDDLNLNDQDAFRADFDNRLSMPFFAGPLKLVPFAGFRYTHYSNGSLSSRSLDRIGAIHGARITTQLSRTFDVSGGPLGLDGLRHVILPEIEYLRISDVSEEVIDVIQFDRVDRFTDTQMVRFGIRNRLQTLREINDEVRVIDFVDLDVEWTWFPDGDRDNGGENKGNIDVDFVFRPLPELTFLTDFEYSFRLETVEVMNATLGWAPSETYQMALGYRRYVDVNDVVLGQFQWRPTERLGLRLEVGYDFVEDSLQDTTLQVLRYGAEWVLEVELQWDNTDEFGFGFSITPRGLFDPRLRARSLRNEPRFVDFQQRVIR